MLRTIEKVSYESLPEKIAWRIRRAILAGDLKPGERLIEQKLAAQLDVGQPTLREALKELEIQGFVRKIPNKGTYVTELSKEDYKKNIEVRMTLEVLAVGHASTNLTDKAVLVLEQSVEEMERAAHNMDLQTFHESDLLFHRTIWELADNEYLCLALERITFHLFAYVLLQRPNDVENEFLAAVEQHRQILAGLVSRDPQVARSAFVKATTKFWGEQHRVYVEESQELFGPDSELIESDQR